MIIAVPTGVAARVAGALGLLRVTVNDSAGS